MALNIGELVGFIRTDDSGMRRGLSDAELRMRGFVRDTDGQLRTLDGRFASSGQLAALGLRRGTDEGNRFHGSLGRIAGMAGKLGGVVAPIGKIVGLLGAGAPAAAGLVTTLANIAPAAGVGVAAMLAVKQATFAVQLGTQGMDDALKSALDPSKAKEFDEALKKLSPEARQFAIAVRDLGPAWKGMQQAVQDRLFKNLAEDLKSTAKNALPVLRAELVNTAGALNVMGRGVLSAARGLAQDGTLGKAMGSASKGLLNLAGIPNVVVTALGQVAAAAGPSFERLTSLAGQGASQIGQSLSKAFESGRMQELIENAISLIGDLVDVAKNVGSILGSVFSTAQASGGGLIGTLKEITGSLAEAFASPEVQSGLKALFTTMSTVAKTAAPLLGQALQIIAPVLSQLGPPVQTLIKALGKALTPIIDALGPVLETAAGAVGTLVEAVAPLLPVVGQLVAALLPALTPLLKACQTVFKALAPVISEVASILLQVLSPIISQLPGIIAPLAQILADRLVFFLQLLGDILVQMAPSLVTLGQALGNLLVALAPLIEAIATLASNIIEALMPILTPLIGLIASLASALATGLSWVITNVVVPVVSFLAKLLSGDFSGAWDMAKGAVSKAKDWIADAAAKIGPIVAKAVSDAVKWLAGLPGRAWSALSSLAGKLSAQAASAGSKMVSAIKGKISDAVAFVKSLPGRAKSALGSLGGVLYRAGQSLIRGFINGLKSMFGSVKSSLGGLTSKLSSWKGPESLDKRILRPSGRMVLGGFMRGIADQAPALQAQLGGLTGDLPGMALAGQGAAPAGTNRAGKPIVLKSDGTRIGDLLMEVLRAAVDVRGGNVQFAVTGRG